MRTCENKSQPMENKTGRIDSACMRYGLGKNTMRQLAEQAGAVIKVGRVVLINFSIMDAYFDRMAK